MSSPTFFGEGSQPRVSDTRWRILQKILGATLDGGGGISNTFISHHGSPDTPGTTLNQVWFDVDCFQWFYWDGSGWVAIDQAKGTGSYPQETVVELRQVATACPPAIAWTKGNVVPFDGQGRRYGWNADSTDTDDGISVIKPNDVDAADPGRWIEVE